MMLNVPGAADVDKWKQALSFGRCIRKRCKPLVQGRSLKGMMYQQEPEAICTFNKSLFYASTAL